MKEQAFYKTAAELAEKTFTTIDEEYTSSNHLIYSSPATLAFNSPGAQGFGVKRAGLAIPGSVMLLVAPGCCGRNTTMLGAMGGYEDRFFYLLLDDTDIVTGRHLRKIPEAVLSLVNELTVRPSVVMICITCVDALLGTDMDRVCKKASDAASIPVLPCYMYALTREGRVPPMSAVRKTVYSLLKPQKKAATSVNILGEFAPFDDDCELYDLLKQMGIKTIREISRCKDFSEYMKMSEANFNLVLNSESRLAAKDLKERLNIPSLELHRVYQIDKIQKQYALLAASLQSKIDDSIYYAQADKAIKQLQKLDNNISFSVGEGMNGDCFELSLALLRYGFEVKEIFGTITNENFIYIKKIAALSKTTKIYTNLSPSMLYYQPERVQVTIGKDAAFYHPKAAHVLWNEEKQPFGYEGLKQLMMAVIKAVGRENA